MRGNETGCPGTWARSSGQPNVVIHLHNTNLGAHLASGEGVECDLKRAVFWYRKAAAQKEPEAIHNLGLMHVTDFRRGMKMLERAAEIRSLIPGSAPQMQLGGSSVTRQKPTFRQAIACRNVDSATSFCGSMSPAR